MLGTSSRVRLIKGGQNEAIKVFKLSDDIYITYRAVSTSGPPTIDIKLPEFEKKNLIQKL